MAPSDRRRLDPHRSRDHEFRPGEGLDQPARPAAAAGQELPRNVEAALMSRDNILHRIRTAVGRSAGQPPADPPPVRLRVPDGRDGSARREHDRPRGGAGRKSLPHVSDPRAAAAAAIAGKDRGGLELAVSRGVRHHEPALRADRHHRSRRAARGLRRGRHRHHQRRLRAGRYRHAGDAFEPAGSPPDLAAAPRRTSRSCRATAS